MTITTPTQGQLQKPPIRLRVYRRTQELITLLWDTKGLSPNQKDNISIAVEDNDIYRPVRYGTASGEGIKIEIPETDMALVRHEDNRLSSQEDYWFKVMFGSVDVPDEQLEARIKVHSYGVLPPYEKDDSRKNEHMYGYASAKRKWFKLPLVEHGGVMCLPVVVMNPDEMKEGKRKVIIVKDDSVPEILVDDAAHEEAS
jgi:hypothetical protein